MTEQERMKQGYVWQDDDENMSLQAHTKALVREFNSMPPEDMEGREALLHDIFGKVGKNVWITPPLTAAVGKYVSSGSFYKAKPHKPHNIWYNVKKEFCISFYLL